MLVPRLLANALIGLAIGLISTGSSRAATVYDANADYVPNVPNPNGVWTYGYTTTLGGAFVTHSQYVTSPNFFDWVTPLAGNAPAWGKHITNFNGAVAGETVLHGGPNGEYAVLRFTTPVAGAYDVLASWRGPGDSGDTDLHLLLNSNSGSPLGFTNSTHTSGTIPVSNLLLNAGDTIDMSLGTLGSFFFDTTPVNLVVTRVIPEPSSVLLLSVGLGLTMGAAQRLRRSSR
jgi:hypothetical protein